MAISPNTQFSSGAVYTADQANRFPRGVMAYNASTTTDATITVEEIQITSSAFTAVANRYYKITYYEPQLNPPAAISAFVQQRIRTGTTLAGTQIGQGFLQTPVAVSSAGSICLVAVTTFSAGTQNVIGTLTANGGTGQAARSAVGPAFILVEDIGPS